jgi:hypothetical protein
MTVRSFPTSRRAVLAGAAAASLAPAVAGVAVFVPSGKRSSETAISNLWTEAELLKRRLSKFYVEIEAGRRCNGLPGWMTARGAANELGNRRYDTLVSMLKQTPETLDDLAILGRVVRQEEMRDGPISWAHHQFDRASREYHANV